MLVELFADPAMARTLVFTRTKRGADKVARHLEAAGINVAAIHGNKSQKQREAALAAFRAGRIRGLVATDIAARGIDIDAVTHVINYELPHVPESYVHRIGRTARAGAEGIAISLCGERGARPAARHRAPDAPVDPEQRSQQVPGRMPTSSLTGVRRRTARMPVAVTSRRRSMLASIPASMRAITRASIKPAAGAIRARASGAAAAGARRDPAALPQAAASATAVFPDKAPDEFAEQPAFDRRLAAARSPRQCIGVCERAAGRTMAILSWQGRASGPMIAALGLRSA